MFGRLLRVTGTVLVIAVAFVTPVLATSTPASADTVVNGCTIVSSPTPTNFTNCPNTNFSGADLLGVNLDYANLTGSVFQGALLAQCTSPPTLSCSNATFENATLSQASFTGVTTTSCVSFNSTPTIISTECAGVDLTGANLQTANLAGLNLSDVTLSSADLVGANVSGATFVTSYSLGASGVTQYFGTNFTGADLAGLDLSGVNLSPVTLTGANLTGAQLENDNMSSITEAGSTFGGALGQANLTDANLTGANLSGATLTGANFTGTLLVPSNQSVTATSPAGAVTTWATPAGLPGATPGTCTPASGSTFPLGTTTVTCQVLDASGDVATGTFQVNVVPPPTTSVLLPSNGATVTGGTWLDAAASSRVGIASVSYEVSGGSISDQVISSGYPTLYGYIGGWDATDVPNGTYTLQSVATDVDGVSTTSAPITVTVNNPPPSTTVLIPSNGATLSGTSGLLDASAPGASSVAFEISGGMLSNQVIASGTLALWGWYAQWNTTTVPDGTYTLQSVATEPGGSTVTSAPVTITVRNAVAYVTSGSGSSALVTPIDTATNQAGTPITASDEGPSGGFIPGPIAITPNGETAYVANTETGTGVTPVDLATGTAGPFIPVGGGPTTSCVSGLIENGLAMSPDGSTAWVTSFNGCVVDNGVVTAVDTATNTIKESIPMTDPEGDNSGVNPTALAIAPNGNTVYVLSIDSGPNVQAVTGIVTPIDAATGTAGTPIDVCKTASHIAISPDGTTAYITCGTSVEVLDLATNTVTATIAVTAGSEALTPNSQTLYVTDAASDQVIPISTSTDTVGTAIAVSSSPVGIAVTPDGSRVYVVGSNATVTPIDTATAAAGTPISVSGTVDTTTNDIAIH